MSAKRWTGWVLFIRGNSWLQPLYRNHLYFQPGDGRFSEIELELYKVLRKEETEGEHVHLCEPKPKDKSPGILEPAVGELELLECCDKQELDENLTSSF